ncbi:hypothetical protein VTL71DRAFT_14045 [Oculimacula yallundae]|uniref:Uncharacterized protein n=1 Tax=Oculimacula yallundae TaxID=86028 RepID=A0ABR4CM51_9HELO
MRHSLAAPSNSKRRATSSPIDIIVVAWFGGRVKGEGTHRRFKEAIEMQANQPIVSRPTDCKMSEETTSGHFPAEKLERLADAGQPTDCKMPSAATVKSSLCTTRTHGIWRPADCKMPSAATVKSSRCATYGIWPGQSTDCKMPSAANVKSLISVGRKQDCTTR